LQRQLGAGESLFFLAFRGDLRSHGNALKKQLFDKPTKAKSGK
jgi:hypothetical protein